MDKDYLILKHASASRPSGEWSDYDFDVLYNGVVVGRIMKAAAVPVGQSWLWTLIFGHHEDRTPTHGYAATREAAMVAFAKSWRRGMTAATCAIAAPCGVNRAVHRRPPSAPPLSSTSAGDRTCRCKRIQPEHGARA